MCNISRVKNQLRGVKYPQEHERMILDLVNDYESLENELLQCIRDGGKEIELIKEVHFDKPHFIPKKGGEVILLCLN